MSYVLSSAQMKEIEQRCIQEFGLPARILMENAGNACADYLIKTYPQITDSKVVILHGCGNNSGDGFVIARKLFLAGSNVTLIKVHDAPFTPESEANYKLCEKLAIPMRDYSKKTDIKRWVDLSLNTDFVIDAVFGIGFHGELSEPVKDAFCFTKPVCDIRIAIDIPSGINADTGLGVEGVFVATETLALHCPKLGHLLAHGVGYSGKLTILDIGIPAKLNGELPHYLIDEDNAELPARSPFNNKSHYGKVLVIGGSPGFSGSVIMASQAALRSGAGYCLLMSRPEMEPHYSHITPEIMFRPVPQDDAQQPHPEKLIQILSEVDSVLIGCGLGLDAYAHKLLQIVMENCKAPLIIDADAISLIAQNPDLQDYLSQLNILLTPHIGEFSRLSGITADELFKDTAKLLSEFVERTQSQILLKNYVTIYSDLFGLIFNSAGNDGLATGGSGDVLAGIIASFAAQGMELPYAAINASYLMGKTAEKLAAKRATPSILPSDIIDNLFMK